MQPGTIHSEIKFSYELLAKDKNQGGGQARRCDVPGRTDTDGVCTLPQTHQVRSADGRGMKQMRGTAQSLGEGNWKYSAVDLSHD
jgi:hypothetical protein